MASEEVARVETSEIVRQWQAGGSVRIPVDWPGPGHQSEVYPYRTEVQAAAEWAATNGGATHHTFLNKPSKLINVLRFHQGPRDGEVLHHRLELEETLLGTHHAVLVARPHLSLGGGENGSAGIGACPMDRMAIAEVGEPCCKDTMLLRSCGS